MAIMPMTSEQPRPFLTMMNEVIRACVATARKPTMQSTMMVVETPFCQTGHQIHEPRPAPVRAMARRCRPEGRSCTRPRWR